MCYGVEIMIKGIFVLSIYILLSLITYYIIKKQYRVSVNQTNCLSFKPKISFKYMLVISLLFGIFNLIITIMSNGNYGGDRLNYYIEYQGIRSTTSPLLD